MGTEIERKFLLINDDWQGEVKRSMHMVQGYLGRGAERSVRVRTSGNDKAMLNIKSSTNGITRQEYEYEIPVTDAHEILDNIAIKPVIDKVRYYVERGPHTWEIDVFARENVGLIVAEIELTSEDEAFERPAWLGDEVSSDPRFYNMNIESQAWRKAYPEDLLVRFGGKIDPDNRFDPGENLADILADNDCKDGC